MLKVLWIIVLGCTFFGIIPSLFAQSSDSIKVASTKEKSIIMADRMQRELSLNQKQTQAVRQLLDERFVNLNRDNMTTEKANEKAKQKLSTILTNEQLVLYNKLKTETRKEKTNNLKKNPNLSPSKEDKELDF